jgi:hypothetical protein
MSASGCKADIGLAPITVVIGGNEGLTGYSRSGGRALRSRRAAKRQPKEFYCKNRLNVIGLSCLITPRANTATRPDYVDCVVKATPCVSQFILGSFLRI